MSNIMGNLNQYATNAWLNANLVNRDAFGFDGDVSAGQPTATADGMFAVVTFGETVTEVMSRLAFETFNQTLDDGNDALGNSIWGFTGMCNYDCVKYRVPMP